MASKKSKRSLWDMKIVRRAAWDSLVKLHPVTMMRNPVMFVVEVGSVVTTALLFLERAHGSFAFNLQITLWLWFTVLFANFAEAMAEGRGKAQADALRRAKAETMANRLLPDGKTETVPGSKLRSGDMVLVEAAMARLWKAWRRWTSRRLRANLRR
jgi:K+-transporting ATPase ATPase B chain